jgi:AraC-like DNA-binding protein
VLACEELLQALCRSSNIGAMHGWTVSLDTRSGRFAHRIAGQQGHSLLGSIVGSIFESLRVSGSLWDGAYWWPIHSEPSLISFEQDYGVETKRWSYNERHFREILRAPRVIRGTHSGHSDVFVPVLLGDQVAAVLTAGPFSLARPTSGKISEQWRLLSGRNGYVSDPEFNAYLGASLATLVLDGSKAAAFEELLTCYARLLGEKGRADGLANRALALRRELESARWVERSWDAVRSMIHERSSLTHYNQAQAYDLRALGLSRAANQALVGLAVAMAADGDPIEQAVRRDAFQRAAVDLARETGDTLAGQVGDHGVVFLSAGEPSRKAIQKVSDLAKKASAMARRRFGLSVHFGACSALRSSPLGRCYQAALAAAEGALSRGERFVITEIRHDLPSHSLGDLREQLSREVQQRPALVAAQFERYLEAVGAHCGYRNEATRAHLEVGFERATEVLVRSGSLDNKSLRDLRRRLVRTAGEAHTVKELFESYRQATADLAEAVERPVGARRDRGVRAALEFIHQHFGEPLTLEQVARVAGFAPHYFSELFRKRERRTFEHYLATLRLERAKDLLSNSALSVTRIAELTGLRSPQYLCRVVRASVGKTPLEYRRARLPFWAKTRANRNGTQDKV